MTFDTLRAFLDALDAAGELVRVSHPVSVDRELCEIADRVMKQPGGGRALLFDHPVLMNGSRSAFPVAINLFGSQRRMAMSLLLAIAALLAVLTCGPSGTLITIEVGTQYLLPRTVSDLISLRFLEPVEQ